ncbi:MAG: hypothetical protein ACFB0B_21805 [Thermonemataceae bacterium]
MKKEFKGFFKVMDFSLTHKMLLIRKTDIVDKKPYNTDIGFIGVFYMDITTIYYDLTITQGTDEDAEKISHKCNKEFIGDISGKDIFVLESEGRRYYIGAAKMEIHNNNYYPLETSLGPKRKS